jgi:peptidylprolyl isomerase
VTHRTHLLPLLLALAVGLLAGCGGGDKNSETAATATATPTETATPKPTPAPDNKDLSKKPTVATPAGQPPAQLETKDIVKGKGRRAKKGDKVTVKYVGVAFSTGQQFDASWDRHQTFPFTLGQGMVIPGWDQGIPGMRKGGRRMLTIPPDLAYGPSGSPPAIGPNETLIFIVDMVKVG